MNLTPELKEEIDSRSYASLLHQWRFAPSGTPMFEGDSGKYFGERMTALRSQPGGDSMHVNASKQIGWEQ